MGSRATATDSAPEAGLRFNGVVRYGIAPALWGRLLGVGLVLVGLVVLVATAIAGWLHLDAAVIGWVAALGVATVLLAAAWLWRRVGVSLDADGYRVRWVRGVGTAAARWTEVEDAVTTVVAGTPCVVLRLRDGRTTTIPVGVLAVDKERFVRELQQHLQRGHGLRRL